MKIIQDSKLNYQNERTKRQNNKNLFVQLLQISINQNNVSFTTITKFVKINSQLRGNT